MRNLAFTGFGGFQMGLFMLKNSEGNHEGRINKFDGIEVTNFFSQSKKEVRDEMGKRGRGWTQWRKVRCAHRYHRKPAGSERVPCMSVRRPGMLLSQGVKGRARESG